MNNGLILRCTLESIRYDLDTFEDIPFRLDISAIQNNSIGNNFGLASQNVNLPGTKNNNKFFQAAFDVNSTTARGFKRSIPCQVIQNSADVFTGNLILNNVITNGATETTYDITLVNETVDFTTLIAEQYVSQLDYSDLNHTYIPENITGSWETSSFFNGDVFYPLVDYGVDGTVPGMYNLAMGGQVGKVDNVQTPMLIQQFKPAIRVKYIIDKIFDSVNYEYSSSFFDSTEFNTMYMLASNTDKNGIVANSSTDAGFKAIATFVQTLSGTSDSGLLQFNSEVYDPGNSYDTTVSEFTVINSGQYAFNASIPFVQVTAAGQGGFVTLDVRLNVNGTIVATQSYNLTNTLNGTIGFSTAAINLESGDVVKLDFYYEGIDSGGSPVDLQITSNRSFGTIFAPIAVVGTNVNMAEQFDPSIKSLDFLKGIIEKFNLVIEPKKNERNTLIVEPFDTWADAGIIKDWSDKFDRAEKVSIKHPIQSQPLKINFEDSTDADVLTVYAKENFNSLRPYGSKAYTSNSDIPKGERKVGGFFAPIPTKGCPGAPSMITPILYKEDTSGGKPFKFKPRLAYRINNQGAVGASSGRFFLADPLGANSISISNYSTLSSLQQYPSNGCNSIHFDGGWYPFHQAVIDGFTQFGTFNQYWSRYINELYDDDSRLLTLNMHFEPTDLIDIQLNDKIFIDNAYYRINKISGFNITNRDTVKVELLKTPLRKQNFAKRRIRWNLNNDVADVYTGGTGFLPSGVVVVKDFVTDAVITDPNVLKGFASAEGYRFISGSVYWKDEFNSNNLNSTERQAIRGSIVVDPTAGSIIGAADSGSVGQNVDKALIIGTEIELQRDVQNVMVSGDAIIVGSGSINCSVLSSKNSSFDPGTEGGLLLAASSSIVDGFLNTAIGTFGVQIQDNARQTTVIGARKFTIDGNINQFDRHTHIGGNGFTYYTTSSSEAFVNSVGLGQLPDVPTNPGVSKTNKVIIGDSILTGAQYLNIKEYNTYTGFNKTIAPNDQTFLSRLSWSTVSGSGAAYITLPDALLTNGRFLRFLTDGTWPSSAPSATCWLVASGSQTIDGVAEVALHDEYDGIGIVSTGTEWAVIQRKA